MVQAGIEQHLEGWCLWYECLCVLLIRSNCQGSNLNDLGS